ncbi:unnamed protein product [Camellia sinensis]
MLQPVRAFTSGISTPNSKSSPSLRNNGCLFSPITKIMSAGSVPEKSTNPLLVITSLVIMIFLTLPKQNSSRVHSRFFSIAGGLINPVEFEYMMGVITLRFETLLESEPPPPAGTVDVESSRLELLESEPPSGDAVLLPFFRLMLFKRRPAATTGIGFRLRRLVLLEREEFLERLLGLELLDKGEGHGDDD